MEKSTENSNKKNRMKMPSKLVSFVNQYSFVICLLSGLLIMANLFIQNGVCCLLAFLLMAFQIVCSDIDHDFLSVLFLFSFSNFFKFSKSITTSLFTIGLAFFYICHLWKGLFNKKKVGREQINVLFSYILLSLYGIILLLVFKNGQWKRLLSFLMYFAFPFIIFLFGTPNLRKTEFLRFLGFGFIFSCLSTIFFYFAGGGWLEKLQNIVKTANATYKVGSIRLYRFSGGFLDPNYFSMYGLFIIMMYFVFTNWDSIERKLSIFAITLIFIFCCLSMSKMFLVVVAFCLIAFIFYSFRRKRFLFAPLLFVLLAIAISLFLGSSLLGIVMDRNSNGKGDWLDSLTTGRTIIWERYFLYFFENPWLLLTGTGFQRTPLFGLEPHNGYIGSLIDFGLNGILLCSLYYYLVVAPLRFTLTKVLAKVVLPLGILFFCSFSLSTDIDSFFPLLIAFSLIGGVLYAKECITYDSK